MIWFSRVRMDKNDYFHYHVSITRIFQPLNRCVPLTSTQSPWLCHDHILESLNVNLTSGPNFCFKDLSYKQQKPSMATLHGKKKNCGEREKIYWNKWYHLCSPSFAWKLGEERREWAGYKNDEDESVGRTTTAGWVRWFRCKQYTCNVGDLGLIPGLTRFPWRRAWQPTAVFLLGEFHGERSLEGYSAWDHKESETFT